MVRLLELLGREADEGAGEELVPGLVELQPRRTLELAHVGRVLEEAVDVLDRGRELDDDLELGR